jgi:NAD(P)-dependent dehydrogenase (short-subunit alcohol dehydrogenase family)
MDQDLNGRVVVITGAAGGIGTAMAEAFASVGARLALVDIVDPGELACASGAGPCGLVL